MVRLKRVPQAGSSDDAVGIASADSADFDHAFCLQVCDDRADPALGDADIDCDVAEARFWVSGEAHKNVGVITEKSPLVRNSHAKNVPQ